MPAKRENFTCKCGATKHQAKGMCLKRYFKSRYNCPEIKARHNAYFNQPEIRAKRKVYARRHGRIPEVRARRNALARELTAKKEFRRLLALYDKGTLPRHLALRLEALGEYYGYELRVL